MKPKNMFKKGSETVSSEEIDTEDEEISVKCEECGKGYSSVSAKNAHFKSKHQGRRFLCTEPNCKEDFVSKFAYQRHMEREHQNELPSNTVENEVYVSHKVEMSDAAKNALIDRLKNELEAKDKIIEAYKLKVKELESKFQRFNMVINPLGPELGIKALNKWIEERSEGDFLLEGKELGANFLLNFNSFEINDLLSVFVKSICKPDGSEYAPDTVFYLILAIQKYLLQNGKYLNIVFDRSCKGVSDALDQVLTKSIDTFLNKDTIQTRIEEEYLWECCYLGAYSPEILLATIIYFNLKFLRLALDDQKKLKFSDITVHSDRNVLSLRCNDRKYEKQVGAVSGFRCPVRYFEYYLSKCSAEVKNENHSLLLSPIIDCSPLDDCWFSTEPLAENELKMIMNRSKMVKEVIVSYFASQ